MIENISVNELKKLNNANIIDIRSIEKYNNGYILNAKNISMEQLIVYPHKYLNKNQKYYIYCQKGIQSRKLCQILKKSGFYVIDISGGYEEWMINEGIKKAIK